MKADRTGMPDPTTLPRIWWNGDRFVWNPAGRDPKPITTSGCGGFWSRSPAPAERPRHE
jgi:hypothetical protein